MKVAGRRSIGIIVALCGIVAGVAIARLQAQPRADAAIAKAQADAAGVSVDANNIGGVVSSAAGPEAGVWVIAETTDFQTKFRKIVVTDDRGRYLMPELPKANYKIWVRGYGLVDSQPVDAAPGKILNLTAVVAPTPADAAQYCPRIIGTPCCRSRPKTPFR